MCGKLGCKRNVKTSKGLKCRVFLNLISGLHMATCSESVFVRNLQEMCNILQKEVKLHPEKQVMFRSTLPQHFDSSDGSGYYNGQFKPTSCAVQPTVRSHWTNEVTKHVSMQYGFKYLDSAPIYMDRWDLHFPDHVHLDCTHFCYTPETFVPEFVLLNQLLK